MKKMKTMLIAGITVLALGVTSMGAFADSYDDLLQAKKDRLAQRVTAGTMTQVEADKILDAIKANMKTCNGTGSAKIGQSMGAAFGHGKNGTGKGMGNGVNATKKGLGKGQGRCDGSCLRTNN